MENDVDQDDGLVTLVLLIEKIRFSRPCTGTTATYHTTQCQ
jgi:hypothetical protein